MIDPQQQAIELINTDIIISASAGSGKTYTLIERLKKRIIQDGLSIDQICALTFTDAAAAEMKERLLKALIEERALTNNERLSKEISLVETAQISTIHGFCLNIIKNYGYILNLDPDRASNILNQGIVTKLKKQALDITLQEAYKRDDIAINILLDTFVDNPAYLLTFEENILDTAKYLAAFTDRENQTLTVLGLYNTKEISGFPLEIQNSFFDYHVHHLSLIFDKLNAFVTYVEDVFFEHMKDVYQDLQISLGTINELKELAVRKDISFHPNIPKAFETLVIPMFRGAFTSDLDKETYATLSDEYAACINDLLKDYDSLEKMFSTLNDQAPIVEALLNISLEYLTTFDLLKEEAKGYDFDDFIYYAMKILQHNDYYIADILKDHYEEIMVDEFQDTNTLQNDIITAISKGNNIFRVGDLKQSIYGFQGARPALMRSMMYQEHSETIHFKYNFRSKENIVDYNNTLFSNLMNTLEPGSYNKKDLAHVKELDFSGKTNIQTLNPHSVDFNIYLHGEASNRNFDKQHASLISDTIYNLMQQNLTIDVQKGDKIEHQPLDFKHITVLVRGHKAKSQLKIAFDKANIPHNIVNHQGFFQSDLMKQTIDWLRYYITKDDYYLVSLLNSPFIGMSLDEISQLRINSDSKSLIISLETNYPDTFKIINDTYYKWEHMDLVDSLVYLATLNDAYSNHFSLQAKTNFDFLLEKASSYQSSSNPNILGFVDYIDSLSEKSRFSSEITDRVSESRTLDKSANYVNVATMHGSKGLQYPITIVWPDSSVNQKDTSKSIVSDDLFTLSLKDSNGPYFTQRTSILRTLSAHKQSIENIQEYLRLFYVALTRATHKLIIVDLISEKQTLDKELDLYLMHNFRNASQLIAAGSANYFDHDKHVNYIDVNTYESRHSFPIKTTKKTSVLECFDLPIYPIEDPVEIAVDAFFPEFFEATQYGTLLHEAIENLPNTTWSKDDLSNYTAAVTKVLTTYNTHEITQKLYDFDMIEHEMPILYIENGNAIQGIIDFYAINKDSVVLVDFKSDAVDIDTIKNRYVSQIDSYKKALDSNYQGLEIIAYIYSFYHNKYIAM